MIGLILFLVVAAVLLYILRTFIPMDGRIYNAIIAVILLFAFLYLLGLFGYGPGLRMVR